MHPTLLYPWKMGSWITTIAYCQGYISQQNPLTTRDDAKVEVHSNVHPADTVDA